MMSMEAKIPKYVERMLQRRAKLAAQLIDACVDVDNYCEKIGLGEDLSSADSAAILSNVMIYLEPWNAYERTKQAIVERLTSN